MSLSKRGGTHADFALMAYRAGGGDYPRLFNLERASGVSSPSKGRCSTCRAFTLAYCRSNLGVTSSDLENDYDWKIQGRQRTPRRNRCCTMSNSCRRMGG